ncbi:MAG: GIY-YIG nuclease family protein [Ignavibacteriae bacterium]|nr:GIY-YIG nuclease family protein [Ignavibacteriota bacterium]
MKQYYVYILECADGSYYTGVTNDITRRLIEHQDAVDPTSYTAQRRPVRLVFLQDYLLIEQAIRAEKQIKGWSRAKKSALIARDMESVRQLSECRNGSASKRR